MQFNLITVINKQLICGFRKRIRNDFPIHFIIDFIVELITG